MIFELRGVDRTGRVGALLKFLKSQELKVRIISVIN